MANMCSNIVKFSGENAQKVIDYINSNTEKFDVIWTEIDTEAFEVRFETKWTPCTDVFTIMCRRFEADMTYQYEELGFNLYGETIYKDGKVKTFKINKADLLKIEELENSYKYNGEEYSSRYDILDIIIDTKKKKYYEENA